MVENKSYQGINCSESSLCVQGWNKNDHVALDNVNIDAFFDAHCEIRIHVRVGNYTRKFVGSYSTYSHSDHSGILWAVFY